MKKISPYLTLIFTALSLYAYTQTLNRPVPPNDVYPHGVTIHDTTDYGYYFATQLKMIPSKEKALRPRMTMYDKDGYLVWYSTNNTIRYFNFQYQPDTNLFSCYFWNNPSGYQFLDSTMSITETFNMFDSLYINPHEFLILKNGNVAFTVYTDSVMDLSAYTFSGVQGSATTNVMGDVLMEVDPTGAIVFRWSTFDHIYPTEAYEEYGYYANGYDYTHANSIAEDNDGHFLISFRHLDAVYKIHRTTGQVLWRIGGKSNDFTFTNDTGFSAQHDFRSYPDGTYSLFDNAVLTTNDCRAMIISLDTLNMTASKVWEHLPNPAFPALLMGNHQITSDLNHLINYGTNRRPHPSFELIDNGNGKIAEFFFEDSILSYRVNLFKLPFEFPRPLITCTLSTEGLILSAPSGHQSYKWSTGETTKDIIVSDTGGVYQVWVKYGVGMLGSFPFDVSNPANSCEPMSINEPSASKATGPYKIYDLLGRQILQPETSRIYIYRYDNGHSELRYHNSPY